MIVIMFFFIIVRWWLNVNWMASLILNNLDCDFSRNIYTSQLSFFWMVSKIGILANYKVVWSSKYVQWCSVFSTIRNYDDLPITVSSKVAGWEIPQKWRFLARKIIYKIINLRCHVWLPEDNRVEYFCNPSSISS
jgi:hypothetical protein